MTSSLHKNPKKYFYDISQSIQVIQHVHLKHIHSLKEYRDAIAIQDSVERRLMVIGRASFPLKKMGIQLPKIDEFIERAEKLITDYDQIQPEIIWKVIQDDLPPLKARVDQLLAS